MSNLNLPLPSISSTVTLKMSYGNAQLLRSSSQAPAASPQPVVCVSLSPRQTEVLRLLVQGHSNKQIARDLGLAEGTVKIHIAALFHKLGVTSRTAAAVAGARLLASQPLTGKAPEGQAVSESYPFGPE